MRVEVRPPSKPLYSLVDLTEAQFDIILACLAHHESGGTDFGEGVPYVKAGRICNGTKVGGGAVFYQIDEGLREQSRARLK